MQQQANEVAIPNAEEMRLRMGELTPSQVRISQAAYRMGYMAAMPRSLDAVVVGMPVGREIFGRTWYTAEQMRAAVSLSARLAAPLEVMLTEAGSDALDYNSDIWRKAMMDAVEALEEHEATLPKPNALPPATSQPTVSSEP